MIEDVYQTWFASAIPGLGKEDMIHRAEISN
jgi:hypothetical protein